MIKECIVQDIGTTILCACIYICVCVCVCICFLAASGLNFSMQDLHCVIQGLLLWHMDSLVVSCKLSNCREGLVTPLHVES